MQRGADGTWTLEADLPDGTHTYTYHLVSLSWFQNGKEIDVPDPLGRFVSADRRASTVTIPPSTVAEQYAWKHDAVPHPDHERLAIYEVYVQDFHGSDGTFAGVEERLAHIADLGFTAIEVMPLTASDTNLGWGYTPCFFFAVEPRFGSEAALCQLVDAAHGRGLVVLFDGVYNHASKDCPLAHLDHDCYFHHAPKDPAVAWGPQFNYALCLPGTTEYPGRHFIKQKVAHWIHLFHFDGIRYDAVSQMQDRDFLAELTPWARDLAGAKPFYAVAECLPVDLALVGPGSPMDACWNEAFSARMRALLAGAWDGDALERCFDCRKDGFPSGRDAVIYLASHDTGYTVRHLLDKGLDEAAALYRHRLGLTVLFTAVGLPMVWMGDEFGCPAPSGQEPRPLDWKLLDDPRRRGLCDLTRGLLALRARMGALRGDGCAVLHRDDARQVLVVHRWDEAGGRVLIAVHGGDGDVALTVKAPAAGRWHEHILDFVHDTGAEDALLIELGGWQAQVFVHQPG
jgi:1,4-alpha-glucan branching enzyme